VAKAAKWHRNNHNRGQAIKMKMKIEMKKMKEIKKNGIK
jgi:hypothetical protein